MVWNAQHSDTYSKSQGQNSGSNLGEKSTFSEYGHVAYQIKWMKRTIYK